MNRATPSWTFWRFPVIVAGAYLVSGIVWILTTDWLVEWIAPTPEALVFKQTYKGLGFVLVTGLLLFLLLWYESRRRVEREALINLQATLLDNAKVAVIVRRWDGNVISINKGAEELYGWPADEVVGKDFRELVYGGGFSSQTAEVESALLQHGSWQGERRHRTRGGKEIVVASNVTLLRDSRGEPETVLCINADVTERKFLEQQLRNAQKLESVGALTAGISHDFNNILAVVDGYADVLLSTMGDRETDRRAIVEAIRGSAAKGRSLVRRLTMFLKKEGGTLSVLSLATQVREIVPMLRDTFPSSITIKTEFEEDLPMMRGDSLQLQQVVLNLGTNARDAIINGGTITFRVRKADRSEVNVRNADSFICLEVNDTGEGIPDDVRENLFDPFVTTKAKGQGTGIGLWVVEGVVRSHRGWIEVDSHKGRGTSFLIYFPAADGGRESESEESVAGGKRHPSKPVLAIEPHPAGAGSAATFLRQHGYEVVPVPRVEEGLKLYEGDTEGFVAIVLDLDKPENNGPAAVARFREISPDVPILVIAGTRLRQQEDEFLRRGADDCLSKPYGPMELLRAMEGILVSAGRKLP